MISEAQANHHHGVYSRTLFGFWVYIMTDCILFSCLFATYLVLHNNTYGGPSAQDLFSAPYALVETLFLLASSFTCGMAMLSIPSRAKIVGWFAVTFLLGASFVAMEVTEFVRMVHEGHSWEKSAFLSSFFTLVGTHGLHVSIGLLWMIILVIPVLRHGLTAVSLKRLNCLRLFWHFLDVVWIFIFTIVYLMGVS
ncbi:MAG: cytochrome o ubiquinol oxidase subunit III [Verrucomicrobiota bacterium]|nr:cytochrome o ubiquinol oxidase subunit III [Verrucomicrobiota bacterium]